MRRRLYFILPDVESARRTADDLLLARVEDRHMRFLAKRGTELDPLHEAGYLDKTDMVHGAAVACRARSHYRRACRRDGGGVSAGRHEPAARRGARRHADRRAARRVDGKHGGRGGAELAAQAIQADIEAGRVLMMVDVPFGRVDEITELVVSRHPEALPAARAIRYVFP